MGAASSTPTSTTDLTIFVGTWNLGNERPPEELTWIPANTYDIYAIGVQECVYEPRPGYLSGEMDWFVSVHKAIGEKNYDLIAEQTLSPRTDETYKTETSFRVAVEKGEARASGIRMSVFAKKKVVKEIINPDSIEILFQACGRLNNTSGNKGGIAVSFSIQDVRISLITSHLNAHLEKEYLERRNQDYQLICSDLHPTHDIFGDKSHEEQQKNPDVTLQFEVPNRNDLVLWFGDLNYRIELPLGTAEAQFSEILDCVEEKAWDALIQYDQLKQQQRLGRSFVDYDEAPIAFAPTFKLSKKPKNSREIYSNKRLPAYCDRILWKKQPYVNLTCEQYVSHPEVPLTSDHLPVTAVFKLCVPACKKVDTKPLKKKHSVGAVSNLRFEKNPATFPVEMEPETPICVIVFHKLAWDRSRTSKVPASIAQWDDKITLETEYTFEYCCQYPLLFAVRNTKTVEPTHNKLGEGMLSLSQVDPSGDFVIPLYQRGISLGKLHGKLSIAE